MTCVDWGCVNETLYSGSSDQHIVEWNVGTGHETWYVSCNIKKMCMISHVLCFFSKWKADRQSVECVCCHSDGSLLLSAGRAIKLWNLHDYTLIKVGGACHHTQLPLCSYSVFMIYNITLSTTLQRLLIYLAYSLPYRFASSPSILPMY